MNKQLPGEKVEKIMDSLKLLLFLFLYFSLATAKDSISNELVRRQLPSGLECPLSELTSILEGFPVDELSGQPVCRNSVTGFILIPTEQYAERQAEVFQHLSQICNAECLPHVVDVVDSCYSSFRVPLAQACGFNGRFQCWQGATVNNGTGVAFACFATLTGLVQQCTDDCRNMIEDIRSELGCCVNNVFNTTVFGPDLAALQVASGALWDNCGVNRTDFCPDPDAFSTTTTTTAIDMTTATGTAVSPFHALMIFLCLLAVKLG